MKKNVKGFTLVELLVAMAIIAVLIGLSVYGIGLALRASRDTQREETLNSIRTALTDYLATNNSYPGNTEVSYANNIISVGNESIEVEGHLVPTTSTDSNGTQYCYGKTSSGYLLSVELENGQYYELGTEDSNSCGHTDATVL